jgi:integrative and conjugative element protein (TIGR02256 family)
MDESAAQAPIPPRLSVHHKVMEQLHDLRCVPWEIGGWLLGYWAPTDDHVVVTHATPPGRWGTPFGVRISGAGHRDVFDDAWNASGGHVTFLGDWHTHPGGPALPSATDKRAMDKLAVEDDYGTPRPLMAIVQHPRFKWSATDSKIGWFVRNVEGLLQELAAGEFQNLPAAARNVPIWRWPRSRRSDGAKRRRS